MQKENKYSSMILKSSPPFDSRQVEVINEICEWGQKAEEFLGSKKKSLIKSFFSKESAFKGFYLYGSVGSGKSTICRKFFELFVSQAKVCFHFHEFMQLIHQKLFFLRTQKKLTKESLIEELARDLARTINFLYLDEMVVSDVADAMILGNVIHQLCKQGIVVMVTSNFHPDELYKDGVQRQTFLSAIELIKSEFIITKLISDQDYRYLQSLSRESFYLALSKEQQKRLLDKLSASLDIPLLEETKLDVNGRELVCRRTYKNIVIFTFEELCGEAQSSGDYIAICNNFNIVILTELRSIKSDERNEARRLINFIDTAYDKKIKLFVLSSSKLEDLYPKGALRAEFRRALSRLNEMLS